MEIVIKQDILQGIIDAIEAIVDDDVKLQLLPDGFRISAVDPASVAMVFMQAKKEACDFYQADQMDIALSIQTLKKFTDIKGQPVSIKLDEETHKLKISQGKTKYHMSLIDPNAIKEGPRIPKLDMPCEVIIAGSDLNEAIRAVGKVSDHAIFEQDEEKFMVHAKGDIDSAKVDFLLSELTGVKQGVSRALFSLDYLIDMMKVFAKAGSVKIESGIDYPARFSFQIGDHVAVQYLLAPRIEQDD